MQKKLKSEKTICVIVTYHTNLQHLMNVLDILSKQCRVIICDNTDAKEQAEKIKICALKKNSVYISMMGNVGIACAQNKGITTCWKLGAKNAFLLDDDSIPSHNVIVTLELALESLSDFTVVGARTISKGKDISNAISRDNLIPCRDLMSSGALINRKVFECVGEFDERLFIDCVDFDWGWRAIQIGVKLYLIQDATIEHSLGIGTLDLSLFSLRLPSPIRHYYQFRNILRIISRSHVPWFWKVEQMIKLPIKLLLILIIAPESSKRTKFALLGIFDAIRGCWGKIPEF